ncbi:MAG: RsmB/NOP family class I SAM-dependent RNA methyltransferase [Spirochaetales bacterium]
MGRETFETFYASLYKERWISLKQALLQPTLFYSFEENLRKPYFLNLASYLAAKSLGPVENRTVLDLCAAPGGKTLVLASSLGAGGAIIANERSAERRYRLKRVLEEYLYPETLARIKVSGYDAARWGLYEKEKYDQILLDVPCSSERHLLEKPSHLNKWSPARTRHLAQQAYTMTLSALMALKTGGTLLYCTCALSPYENDQVIERVLEKKAAILLPLQISHPDVQTEATPWGIYILPDLCKGAGPLYVSLLTKK